MIFERRRYTTRVGKYDDFIAWQYRRGFDGPFASVLERLIGYFTTVSGPADQIVHLYRYDDFDDWIARLHGLYGVAELEPYFVNVRPMLAAQETEFFNRAPLDALTPLWNAAADWLPGPGAERWKLTQELIVEEHSVSLRPGGLIGWWDAMNATGLAATAPLRKDPLASWVALTGRQHVVVSYNVFATMEARDAAHAEASSAMAGFQEAVRDLIVARETRLLRPVPVPEMSPMFRFAD